MDKALGLLGILVFIPSVIALAAAVTWLVVRLTPRPQKPSGAASDSS